MAAPTLPLSVVLADQRLAVPATLTYDGRDVGVGLDFGPGALSVNQIRELGLVTAAVETASLAFRLAHNLADNLNGPLEGLVVRHEPSLGNLFTTPRFVFSLLWQQWGQDDIETGEFYSRLITSERWGLFAPDADPTAYGTPYLTPVFPYWVSHASTPLQGVDFAWKLTTVGRTRGAEGGERTPFHDQAGLDALAEQVLHTDAEMVCIEEALAEPETTAARFAEHERGLHVAGAHEHFADKAIMVKPIVTEKAVMAAAEAARSGEMRVATGVVYRAVNINNPNPQSYGGVTTENRWAAGIVRVDLQPWRARELGLDLTQDDADEVLRAVGAVVARTAAQKRLGRVAYGVDGSGRAVLVISKDLDAVARYFRAFHLASPNLTPVTA